MSPTLAGILARPRRPPRDRRRHPPAAGRGGRTGLPGAFNAGGLLFSAGTTDEPRRMLAANLAPLELLALVWLVAEKHRGDSGKRPTAGFRRPGADRQGTGSEPQARRGTVAP
ncbi:hypothetical protein [Streptomyces sp. 6N223]|uniref:hypothetical protein n=1 Tax=Streptomyces sp. 6N223 TaxID=3457412 RepID=UPI003FD1805B